MTTTLHMVAFLCLTIATSSIAAEPVQEETRRRPNIIIILADDLGIGDVGVYGCEHIPTPHIDSIAARGALFTQAYSSWPACNPSRAALLTGMYQTRFGFDFNPARAQWAPEGYGIPLEIRTLPERLKEVGYVNGVFGKYAVGFSDDQKPLARGFDEFYGFLEAGFNYLPEEIARRQRRRPLLRGDEPVPVEQITEYLTDSLARECVEFIDRHRDDQFFVFFSPSAPHVPLEADEARLRKFAHLDEPRRTYAAMVSALDDAVGSILAAVESTGTADRTIVLFTSDNGAKVSAGGHNGALREGKGSLYEGGIRVPLVAMWPARIPPGLTLDDPVITMDVTCTALAAAGLTPAQDDTLDGVSLLPWCTGTPGYPPHSTLCWRAYSRHGHLRWAIRSGEWKLVVNRPLRAPELYDLSQCPGEERDVAAENPDVVRQLTNRWIRWDMVNQPYRHDLYVLNPLATQKPNNEAREDDDEVSSIDDTIDDDG